jgi:hypothetical protein
VVIESVDACWLRSCNVGVLCCAGISIVMQSEQRANPKQQRALLDLFPSLQLASSM